MNIRLLQREEVPQVWGIDRREVIENIYVFQNGRLLLRPDHFDMHGWPPGEAEHYTPILLDCYDCGGMFWGVFENNVLVGVAVLDTRFIGSALNTLQLKFLHVSRDYRNCGLGSTLFKMAVEEARARGAQKLYISATPSENTINYYSRLGCIPATEVDAELFALEPDDIHLEYVIS